MTNILICTVGGSHQPIVSAIYDQRPDYVIFICTDKDSATGRAGSSIQITGTGNCIKDQFSDDKPTLPNIPAQTGLTAEQFEVCSTLSDDLDQIYLACSHAIDSVFNRFPNAKIVADYTGGTKSMSAGLVMAALERQDIELQLITGSRSDLIKVHDGSQYAACANIEQIRFERLIAPYRQAWTRFAYSEAEAGLQLVKAPNNNQLRGDYARFRELSHAFAEWDNFNHQAPLVILQRYAPSLPGKIKAYLAIAMRLNDNNIAKREAAQLLDLFLNAQRRAAQGRFDDAIARVYRLIEWTAQWLLKNQCGIETANVDKSVIPEGVTLTQNRDGQWQAGLFAAWQLVKFKTAGEAASFINREEKNLFNHIKIRNKSILAHGFEPVKACDWQIIQSWLDQQFIPMLLAEAASVGIKELPAQLPKQYSLR
ncbi:MAG: TIGR02710 family CRISPR-associated CARF protein [Methylococcales bacterium]|nr:TIGR02710 family CRISPR-associated protein [Methylococcaceae bacterium]